MTSKIELYDTDFVKMFVGEKVTTPDSSTPAPIEQFRSVHGEDGKGRPYVLVSGTWYYHDELLHIGDISGKPRLRAFKNNFLRCMELHSGEWHISHDGAYAGQICPSKTTLFLGYLHDASVVPILEALMRARGHGIISMQAQVRQLLWSLAKPDWTQPCRRKVLDQARATVAVAHAHHTVGDCVGCQLDEISITLAPVTQPRVPMLGLHG